MSTRGLILDDMRQERVNLFEVDLGAALHDFQHQDS